MTGEVQPVCGRCGHTQVEHSTGPCHQRSAAGVGCDCGGWAETVTGGEESGDSAPHAGTARGTVPSGDPLDTAAIRERWAWFGAKVTDTAIGRDLIDALAEVDRLRAIEEWAIDAAHHPGCFGGFDAAFPCRCGHRDLFPELEADRD